MSDCSLCWFLTLSHVCIALLTQKIRSASTKANLEFIDFCVLGVCVCKRTRVCVHVFELWADMDLWVGGITR